LETQLNNISTYSWFALSIDQLILLRYKELELCFTSCS